MNSLSGSTATMVSGANMYQYRNHGVRKRYATRTTMVYRHNVCSSLTFATALATTARRAPPATTRMTISALCAA